MEFLIYASHWKDIVNKKYKLCCLALMSLQWSGPPMYSITKYLLSTYYVSGMVQSIFSFLQYFLPLCKVSFQKLAFSCPFMFPFIPVAIGALLPGNLSSLYLFFCPFSEVSQFPTVWSPFLSHLNPKFILALNTSSCMPSCHSSSVLDFTSESPGKTFLK